MDERGRAVGLRLLSLSLELFQLLHRQRPHLRLGEAFQALWGPRNGSVDQERELIWHKTFRLEELS